MITPGECPIHLNVTGWNTNQAYIRYGNGLQVCERATIRYHAANISFRCGGSPVDSFCDLNLYASQGDELSLYTENATFSNQYTVGKAYMNGGGCI